MSGWIDSFVNGWKQTGNHIVDLWENDCDAPWHAYITTAIPAAGSSLWMLLVPQPDEILEEFLDPSDSRKKGGRRRRGRETRRTLGRAGRMRRWISDATNTNSMIADKIPGRRIVRARRVGRTEYAFWSTLNIAERGLWYWLLMDAGQNFVAEWSSGIMDSRYCNKKMDLWGRYEPPTTGGNPKDWLPQLEAWVPTAQRQVEITSDGLMTPAMPVKGTVAIEMTLTNHNDIGRTVQASVGQFNGPSNQREIDIEAESTATISVGCKLDGDGPVGFTIGNVAEEWQLHSGQITIMGMAK